MLPRTAPETRTRAEVLFEALCTHILRWGGNGRLGLHADLEPERTFTNHLAFPGTAEAPVCVLHESQPVEEAAEGESKRESCSRRRCAGARGLAGGSFSLELTSRNSRPLTFAQLSEALVDGARGSFIFLVIDGDGLDGLDGLDWLESGIVDPLDGGHSLSVCP